MKKILLAIMLVPATIMIHAQQRFPQYIQNGSYLYDDEKTTNDDDELTKIQKNLIADAFSGGKRLSEKERLNMLYRRYEISKTSRITYTTVFEKSCDFLTETSPTGTIELDCGARLIRQVGFDKKYALCFGSPVTQIDPQLFQSAITSIDIPWTESIRYISSPAINVENLNRLSGRYVIDSTALVLPDGRLIVAATYGCDNYRVHESVTNIDDGALHGTLVKQIVVPAGVTSIGHLSLAGSRLTSVYMLPMKAPAIEDDTFGIKVTSPSFTIYVPKKALKDYKKKWPLLKEFLQPIPKGMEL